MAELSPMMRQYFSIKEQHKDHILFFRLGDFYEMFYDDAKIASEELELVLTGRDCGQEERAPMCGVPFHSCESYIARLVEKGYKVAICEQVEDPATAKGIVKRDVVRVITPGTVIEDTMLDESRNNYLACVHIQGNQAGLCFADISTGSILVTALADGMLEEKIKTELGRFSPSELLVTEENKSAGYAQFTVERLLSRISVLDADYFSSDSAQAVITAQFPQSTDHLNKLGPDSPAYISLGALLRYLNDTQITGLSRLADVTVYTQNQYMNMDINTIRNLELCETMMGKQRKGSLLWVLDKTKSALGKRRLRAWLEQPLLDIKEINGRLNAVDELVSNPLMRGEVRELLTGIHDIERLMTRIVYGTAGARELNSLAFTALRLPPMREVLAGTRSAMLKAVYEQMDPLEDIQHKINTIINDDPPVSVREGGMIREGYNQELDFLRASMTDGKNFIARIESIERERTGIKNLKVRYNKVFGYYIEVTNSYKDLIPPEYIRKQTLVNSERYITDELKRLEAQVLGARERSAQMEFEIFDALRKEVASQLERIQATADALAVLDAFCALAETAAQNNYCRPTLNTDGKIHIIDGRHPVVEQISKQLFVPNDTLLDAGDNRCAIITGPNMAGKSTYMRQVAIISIMAQIGSFVPATSANLGVVDAVFTRVGASDDLSAGQSTFMVEMSEVAHILKNATQNSLVILDEIGRGTSTYDGMSIARAVLEYVTNKRKIGAKTLFATHYHELTNLEGMLLGVKNYNIAAKKHGDDITFLRKIVRGGADDSYGIEVAKLSGIPVVVIERAKQILKEIESEGVQQKNIAPQDELPQLPLEVEGAKNLLNDLREINVNTITPMEALHLLSSFVNKANNL